MERTQEVIDFEDKFDKEYIEIVAVTGASGFGGGRVPQDEYWTTSIKLTAWHLNGDMIIHTEASRLVTKADDAYLRRLRECADADMIIKVKVRQKENDFLLVDLPVEVEDAALQPILEEQIKPVYYEDEIIGTFTLDKRVNTFERKVDWLEQSINLCFDNGTKEDIANTLKSIYQIVEAATEWDTKVRAFAAKKLLDLKNDDWTEDEEDTLTKEEFMTRISISSICVKPDGEVEFWLDDGDIFWGHTILVSGSVHDGLEDAELYG